MSEMETIFQVISIMVSSLEGAVASGPNVLTRLNIKWLWKMRSRRD